ncbi:MAG: dicarboxylate/amino acid:cation symporter [Bdellovibrionales bacterium]|nr:dicarboxylate/amino acid:cation symporter [Bdellovibrionales bacterium]
MLKKMPLHIQILLGLVFGLLYGILAVRMGWVQFTQDWINPFGTIFVRLLKLIAVPLVLASLITGVASLSDLQKLSRIGGKTIGLYLITTAIALVIGILVANVINPGLSVPDNMREQLQEVYKDDVAQSSTNAELAKQRGPLQPLVDMVPDNIFAAATDNRLMLQIVFFSILFGIGLIQVEQKKAQSLIDFFHSANDVIIRMVDMIMLMAPLGVFALLAKTVTAFAGQGMDQILELLGALGLYCVAVVLGLGIHSLLVLPAILKLFTPLPIMTFVRGMAPAQLLAFSTSSSGATLPLTMERCEEELGISEEVASFVLPLGATINMDGTGLYQAVAAIFISQAMGIGLSFGDQLTIILTAVLASIGTAAVPGAGIIMLVVILESIGVPSAGIALILGVDRILDMMRTVTNVTGDAVVATVVAASEGQLHPPQGSSK